MENIKSGRGGFRVGSGAKLKYNEATTTVSFRVPISLESEIKVLVSKVLSGYKYNTRDGELKKRL